MLNKWWLNICKKEWFFSHSLLLLSFLSLWYYVRLFRTVNFILFLFSVYSYDIISCYTISHGTICTKAQLYICFAPCKQSSSNGGSYPDLRSNSFHYLQFRVLTCTLQREIEETKVALLLVQISHRETCDVAALCSLPLGTLDLQWSGFFSQWLF